LRCGATPARLTRGVSCVAASRVLISKEAVDKADRVAEPLREEIARMLGARRSQEARAAARLLQPAVR
jgi:DNA repair ATPase RecN